MGIEEEREPRREGIDVKARIERGLHVGDPIRERERQLLNRRRASFTDVIARDRDRVPARDLLGAVGEGVGHQAHGGPGRVDVGAAGDVFLEDVVLDRATDGRRSDTLLVGDKLVEQQQDRRRGVDRHRGGHAVEGKPGKQAAHVVDRVDGHTDLADLALCKRVVGVVSHLGGQVEGARQPGLAGLEQELETFVGLLGRPEPGVLAHRPEPASVHVALNSPRVGVDAGLAELEHRIEALQVLRDVAASDLDAGVGPAHIFTGRHRQSVSLCRRGCHLGSLAVRCAPAQPVTARSGGFVGCGMQSSSYSATTISPACSPQAGQSGSLRILKVRNDCSRAS